MELHRINVLILFITAALAITVLVDGSIFLSKAKFDFADTSKGKIAWTNLAIYEIMVPVLSVFGLVVHILGLHHDFISLVPTTSSEGMVMFLGTAVHSIAWVTISGVWTACEVNTMTVRTIASSNNNNTTTQSPPTQTILVSRFGPSFCPQHSFLDGGLHLDGTLPTIKVALSWALFALTLVSVTNAFIGWLKARRTEFLEQQVSENSQSDLEQIPRSVGQIVRGFSPQLGGEKGEESATMVEVKHVSGHWSPHIRGRSSPRAGMMTTTPTKTSWDPLQTTDEITIKQATLAASPAVTAAPDIVMSGGLNILTTRTAPPPPPPAAATTTITVGYWNPRRSSPSATAEIVRAYETRY